LSDLSVFIVGKPLVAWIRGATEMPLLTPEDAATAFRDATAAPEDAAIVLRLIAQRCREDAHELAAAWQEPLRAKSNPWMIAAAAIDKAADTIERAA
jgi:hypothetical protein